MNSTKFERKKIRLNGYDYSEPGYYFITICTENKKNYFGIIEKERIMYSTIGNIAKNAIENLNNIYSTVKVDKYIVMPNHIHIILILKEKTDIKVERIVKQYKGSITKIINKSIWQKSYFDRIIRNEKEYYKIWKYIDENVLKWQLDVYYNT